MKFFNGVTSKVAVLATILGITVGCAQFEHQRVRHRANSLYKFLYPAGSEHVDTPTIPTLNLPLRVGVAFVPTETDNHRGFDDGAFSEVHKAELLKQVSDQFKEYPFVKSIEIIPSPYLTPGGGFANLDQLRTMYDLDVMALLSFDQSQYAGEGLLSLTYLTVVGAFVIPGEENDTRTMLDAAVYDLASRKLLFRAPGIDVLSNTSTFANQPKELQNNSEEGFKRAATNLVTGLKVQLVDFQQRVKDSPTEYKIAHRPGYTGKGNVSGMELALIGCAGLAFAMANRSRR